MALLQLTYRSLPTPACDQAEVMRIVRGARAANLERDVTGYLLYRPGRFLQVLEGPADIVTGLFAGISRDPRHDGVALIGARRIERRTFRRWTMGFISVREELREAQEAGGFAKVAHDHDAVVDLIGRLAHRTAA